MENVHQLLGVLEEYLVLVRGVLEILVCAHGVEALRLLLLFLYHLLNLGSLLLADGGVEALQEQLVLPEVLQGLAFRHILTGEIRLYFKLLFDNGHLLVLLAGLTLSLLDCVPRLFFVLVEVGVEGLHVLLQHLFGPLQTLPVQPRHLFELVDFLAFVVDQHLKQQSLSLFADEFVHWLVNFDSIFNCTFGCLNQVDFGLVLFFIVLLLSEIIDLLDGNAPLLNPFLPYLQFVGLELLLPLSVFLFLLHSKYLCRDGLYLCVLWHREGTLLGGSWVPFGDLWDAHAVLAVQ
jgi:hypothetical protein